MTTIASLRSDLDSARREIRDLKDQVERLERTTKGRIDVPPRWVIRAARVALDKARWRGAFAVLSAYYGIPKVQAIIDPSKQTGTSIACYYPSEMTVYSKESTMSVLVGLHEFAHHLCSSTNKIDGEAEQAFCDSFATEIERVWVWNLG